VVRKAGNLSAWILDVSQPYGRPRTVTGGYLFFLVSWDGFRKKKKKGKQVVGLERGPLSLVSTTEELLDKKVATPV
jgi:hypothetical protein